LEMDDGDSALSSIMGPLNDDDAPTFRKPETRRV
jgi:hypothetical protein